MKQKVVAYITRNNYSEILVFDHEKKWSEAGTQVPAGSVDKDEDFEDALRREIFEESGLENIRIIKKIDEYIYHRKDLKEDNYRHVYLVELTQPTKDTWIHTVTGKGIDQNMLFTYRWISTQCAEEVLAGGLGKSIKNILC